MMYEIRDLVWDLAKDTHAHEGKENEAGGGSKAPKHWKQQGRAVSNLIYWVEKFEAAVIALGHQLGPGTPHCQCAGCFSLVPNHELTLRSGLTTTAPEPCPVLSMSDPALQRRACSMWLHVRCYALRPITIHPSLSYRLHDTAACDTPANRSGGQCPAGGLTPIRRSISHEGLTPFDRQ